MVNVMTTKGKQSLSYPILPFPFQMHLLDNIVAKQGLQGVPREGVAAMIIDCNIFKYSK